MSDEAKHDGLPVSGYRPQNQRNVDLVNENKHLEELVLQQLDLLAEVDGIDKRWLAIGRTGRCSSPSASSCFE